MQSSPPALLTLLATAPIALAQPCLLTYHAPAPVGGALLYDNALNEVLLVDTTGTNLTRIWAWDGAAWSLISAGGPIARQGAAIAYDSARDRIVLFGGVGAGSNYLPDTWEWDGSSWSQIIASGPANRGHSAMVYDESSQRTMLFGGNDQSGPFRDTWEWSGSAWTQVPTSGPTPAASGPMTYDSLRHRTMLLSIVSYQAYLWQWDGAQWSQSPTSVSNFTSWIVYDRPRDRLILGGTGIGELDAATGQLTIRQPVLGYGGTAAFDINRSLAVISGTLEYDGSATATSPYMIDGPHPSSAYGVGSTIALSVSAGGAGPLSYRWQRNGVDLVDDGRISGSHTPNLTITAAVIFDSGPYSVLVSNTCHSTGAGANIQVVPSCYANCDGSTVPPILNINDFICFLNRFTTQDPYTNCDGSSIWPIFNVNDFICFTVRYGQGCP